MLDCGHLTIDPAIVCVDSAVEISCNALSTESKFWGIVLTTLTITMSRLEQTLPRSSIA
jgi:hypothetical protein